MKKFFLPVVASLCLLLASCGDEDFTEIQNLNGVAGGEISFALPVGSGTLNGYGLLTKWQNTSAVIGFDKDGVITFNYNDEFGKTIDINLTDIPVAKLPKDESIDTVWELEYSGEMDIDVFKNFPNIDGMEIEGVRADLFLVLRIITEGNVSSLFDPEFAEFIGEPSVSDLTIYTIGSEQISLPIASNESTFKANKLLRAAGDTVHLFTAENPTIMSQVIKSRPKKMGYSLKLNIPLHGSRSQVDAFIEDHFLPSDIQDVVKMRQLVVKGNVSAQFPLRMSLNDVEYTASIAFPLVDVQDAIATASKKMALDADFAFAFKFTNSLPMSLTASDMLMNHGVPAHYRSDYSSSTEPISMFGKKGFVIPAAPVALASSNYARSTGSMSTHALVKLTKEDLDNVSGCDSIVITFKLNTTEHKVVEIMKEDKLVTNMYILVNADDKFIEERFGKNN